MMTEKDDKKTLIDAFLEGVHLARLATVDVEGKPHVVPVWYGWDGDCIWVSAYASTRKVKHLEVNRNLSIVVDVDDAVGETRAVLLEGKAQLITAPPQLLREKFLWIYERYLGKEGIKGKDPQEWIEDPENLLICLKPDLIKTWMG